MTTPRDASYSEALEQGLTDPQEAAAYLNAVLEDGDQEEIMLALRRVASAYGGVPKLAKQTSRG